MTSYQFFKQVNSIRLISEINAGGLALTVSFIETVGNCIFVWFEDELSTEDQTTLSNIVTTHISLNLEEAKQARITQVNNECESYILNKYKQFVITTLNTIGVKANFDGLTNRKNYILTFTSWFVAVNAYTSNVISAISNASTIEEVNNITFNIIANTPADPQVNINTALGIIN